MTRSSIKRTIVLSACLFLLPIAAFAGAKGADKAAAAACKGKVAGDTVEVKKHGKMVKATCQEMNGQLVAVPTVGK